MAELEAGEAWLMEKEGEIRWLGDVQRLRLEPGDVLVLSLKGKQREDVLEQIRITLAQIFPDGQKMIILSDDARLGVLSRQGGEADG